MRNSKDLKCFVIEEGEQTKDNSLTIVELSTKPLYQVDQKIQLFNVFLNDYTLVLFSVLPEQQSNGPSWKEVNIAEEKVMTRQDLIQVNENGKKAYLNSGLQNYSDLKRTDMTIVVHHKNGKYLAAQNCIVEFFTLVDQDLMFPNEMGIFYINTKSSTLSAKEFEMCYQKIYNEYSVNVAISANLTGSSIIKSPGERPSLFLSKSFLIADQPIFQFWSFTNWHIADGLNGYRGIDRFIYMPGKGIVAGSFDFYFRKGLDNNTSLSNYLNEELMLPVKINDKEVKY